MTKLINYLICVLSIGKLAFADSYPSMSFEPKSDESLDSTLIWINRTDYTYNKVWADKLDNFLQSYKKPAQSAYQNIAYCDYNQPPKKNQVCDIDIKSFSPCTREYLYGYHRNKPCVFLQFNKVDGWIPEYYNNSNELPDNMPQRLKDYIIEMDKVEKHRMNTVWVSCDGDLPADKENIGPVDYWPINGFPGYLYPYKNIEGYMSPLVAVHFTRPKTGIVITVECKAWARNIVHGREKNEGIVTFELLIDI